MKCTGVNCTNEMETPRVSIFIWDEEVGAYGGYYCSYQCMSEIGDAVIHIENGGTLQDWHGPGVPGTTQQTIPDITEALAEPEDDGPTEVEDEYPEQVFLMIDSAEYADSVMEILDTLLIDFETTKTKHTFNVDGTEYEYKSTDYTWKGVTFSVHPAHDAAMRVLFADPKFHMKIYKEEAITLAITAEGIAAHAAAVLDLQSAA